MSASRSRIDPACRRFRLPLRTSSSRWRSSPADRPVFPRWTEGRKIVKTIYVPGKLVSVVVK